MTNSSAQLRVLVSGGGGFVGSHVVPALLARACDVAVLIRPGSDTSRIDDALPRVQRVESDVMNLHSARAAIRAFAPQAVAHLAWRGVSHRYRDDQAQNDNVHATQSLLHLAHEAGCTAFIGVGSQAEYGLHGHAMDESTPTRPCTAYGNAKLAACALAQSLCPSLGMRFAWLRLFSTYGPMDSPDCLLPYVIANLLRGHAVEFTAGAQQWDYLYVQDAAEAMVRVIETPSAQGIFNLGSGRTHTIRAIVEQVRDMIDPSAPLQFGARPYAPQQVMHLQADIARLQAATGWSPKVSLTQGLARTIAWHRGQEVRRG